MLRRFCVAPMMGRTDRHERYFLRKLSSRAFLYTEMVHANAVIRNSELLKYNPCENPLGIQLGGCDPISLSDAAQKAQEYGYDEINLNVGCPSKKVREGKFGAVLMKNPKKVADCVKALINSVEIPVSIKCRIGVDDMDSEKDLDNFIQITKDAGCSIYIIHARKALLQGLSPKENRNIPPLDYKRVYRLKEKFPELEIILNGGLSKIHNSVTHLGYVNGIMMGRGVYQDPFQIRDVDELFYDQRAFNKSRLEVFKELMPYLIEQGNKGIKINLIMRHFIGLFKGTSQAKKLRKLLTSIHSNKRIEDQLISITNKLEFYAR